MKGTRTVRRLTALSGMIVGAAGDSSTMPPDVYTLGLDLRPLLHWANVALDAAAAHLIAIFQFQGRAQDGVVMAIVGVTLVLYRLVRKHRSLYIPVARAPRLESRRRHREPDTVSAA